MRGKIVIALAASALLWVTARPAQAGTCESSTKIARAIWKEYEKVARTQGCLSPIKGPRKFLACQIKRAGAPLKIANAMIKFWNRHAGNSWATLGPRRLSASKKRGTLVGTSGRLFVSSVPAFTDRMTIRLDKIGGKGKVRVTVCRTGMDGRTRKVKDEKVRGDRTYVLRNLRDGALVSVHLDGRSVSRKFKYTIRAVPQPIKTSYGTIDGLADVHTHPTGDMAFGGKFTWGSHAGALVSCDSGPKHQRKHFRHLRGLAKLMGYGHHGRPNVDWPTWDDGIHQHANIAHIRRAWRKGMRLAVFSMHDFEPLCDVVKLATGGVARWKGKKLTCKDMESVDRQIEALVELANAHDWLEIAVNPWHARQIINDGKLAVILAVEVSNIFPKGNYVRQLDELYAKGVRSVLLAHETDSAFAGAAMHRGVFAVANAIKNLKNPIKAVRYGFSGFDQKAVEEAEKRNPRGLTNKGRKLLDAMVARRMLIDIEHLSMKATGQTLDHLAARHAYYPVFSSHTRFKELLTDEVEAEQKEFLTWASKAGRIKEHGGVVGLRTGPEPMKTYEEGGQALIENTCHGSSRSFAQMYLLATRKYDLAVTFGSDTNAPVSNVGPRFGADACPKHDHRPPGTTTAQDPKQPSASRVDPEFSRKGLAHWGLLPALADDLGHLGADTKPLRRSAESFLRMWERAWDDKRRRLSPGAYRKYFFSN